MEVSFEFALGKRLLIALGIGLLILKKKFDVRKSLEILGQPSVGISEEMNRFVDWQKRGWKTGSGP